MFIDSTTGTEVNLHATFELPNGDRYVDLTTYPPEVREVVMLELRIVEMPEPQPPAHIRDELQAHPDWYIVSQCTEAPYRTWARRSSDVIDRMEQEKTNAKALAYLAETSWYVERMAETGKPIPPEVSQLRQQARESVVHLSKMGL